VCFLLDQMMLSLTTLTFGFLSGTLTTDEFLSVPELAGNPLLERVIAIFDKNKDDEIEFKEFISALSTFSEKGNKEGKLRCNVFFCGKISCR
jgi:Ca2+-binding EF-hand superfamily protein